MLAETRKRRRLKEYFEVNAHLKMSKVAEAAGISKQTLCSYISGHQAHLPDEKYLLLRKAIKMLTLQQSKYF